MKNTLFVLILTILLLPGAVFADSISPATVTETVAAGESITINKTVTIDALTTESLVDVLFLFDTTGSMGGLLEGAKTNAETILTNAAGLGDVQFAVARYEDFPISPWGYAGDEYWGDRPDTPFELIQDMTISTGDIQTAIDGLAAYAGNDGPESNLFALSQSATEVAWRDGSTRILVWMGDSPGHDAELEAAWGYPGVSLDEAIGDLVAASIIVEAVDVSPYSYWGLDEGYATYDYDYSTGTYTTVDLNGQATAITGATGGDLFSGASPDDIVAIIDEALQEAVIYYNTVDLEVVGADGTAVAFLPGTYTGEFDRTETRTFTFDVTLTSDGAYDAFEIYARVDGTRVAVEHDVLNPGSSVPEPGTLLLLGTGLLGLGLVRRKKDL